MIIDPLLQTPYFVIDKKELVENYHHLKNALSIYWPNYLIGYSYKTNSLPWLVKYFDSVGCYSEVVSADEYELGQYLGISKANFIYNGPIKTKETFIEALQNGCYVNIDSQREIDWLYNLPKDKEYKIGVRINFDVEKYCPGESQCGKEGGRFGFCYENGELLKAIKRIEECGFEVTGLHLHISSKTRSVKIYETIAKIACSIVDNYGLKLDFIDIGGGFFGGLPTKPQFEEYFQKVSAILKLKLSPEKCKLIVEPGMALVGSPISFVTSVIDVKTTNNNRFVITDGSRINIDPLMRKKDYFHENILVDTARKEHCKQIVCGFTCMENDRLFMAEDLPEYEVGDKIIYHKVGAYTMCLSPLFIKYFPTVYLFDKGLYETIREKWTPKQYTQNAMNDSRNEK